MPASETRINLRRTILWVALAGVALAIVLFFAGSLVGTLVRRPASGPATGSVVVAVANDANADGSINANDPREHPLAAELTLTSSSGAALSLASDATGF